jgi:hypothetical protein
MRTILASLFCMLHLFCVAGMGGNKLKFDLSVRQRFELWNGMNARNYGDDSQSGIGNLNDRLLYQRIIAGFTYNPVKRMTIVARMQDSRAFGWSLRNSQYPDVFKVKAPGTAEPYYIMNPGEQFFEINDTYVDYKLKPERISIRAGRQKIFFGDNHIFGPGEWGNTGRWTWDAVWMSFKKNGHSLNVFGGGTKIHDPVKTSIPFTLTEYWGGGVYSHFDLKGLLAVEPFYALKLQGNADYIRDQDITRNWAGLRLYNENVIGLILDGTFAYEWGSQNGKDISAHGFFAKLGYQFRSLPARPIVSVRETYATGGKQDDPVINTFDPVFGASDKYYGWMNIVSWSNLDDREIVLELNPRKDWWVEIKNNWYFIPVPDDVVLLNAMKLLPGKNYLGREFNIFSRHTLNRHWQLVAAFGIFVPGDLEPINNKQPENAIWLAFQVQYTL